MGGRRSSRSWPAGSARTRPRGSFADTTRPSKTSCATSSRPRSRTRGRNGSGTSLPGRWFHGRNPRRYVYRKAVRSSESVPPLSDPTTVLCSVCGHANPSDATVCDACGFALSRLSPEEKVDAILDDLLDLSKAPITEAKPAPPRVPDEPEVDESAAEELFDSLLVEIQPSSPAEPAEPAGDESAPDVDEGWI